MGLSASLYLSHLQALLPPGAAWTREPGANLTKLLQAWADELARLDARAGDDLLAEADPRTADECLPEWERVCGLTATGTPAERRAAVVAALIATGGQSRAYFTGVAAALGYTVTIDELWPAMCGVARCGEVSAGEFTQVLADPDARYAWRVLWSGPATVDALEAVFERLKPAHTRVFIEEA